MTLFPDRKTANEQDATLRKFEYIRPRRFSARGEPNSRLWHLRRAWSWGSDIGSLSSRTGFESVQQLTSNLAGISSSVTVTKVQDACPTIDGLLGKIVVAFDVALDFRKQFVHGRIIIRWPDEL